MTMSVGNVARFVEVRDVQPGGLVDQWESCKEFLLQLLIASALSRRQLGSILPDVPAGFI